MQASDGSKNVPVNSAIAIVGDEGDDFSGADAMAEEVKRESASAATEAKAEESKSEAVSYTHL